MPTFSRARTIAPIVSIALALILSGCDVGATLPPPASPPAGSPTSAAPLPQGEQATVVHVIDGDTIIAILNGREVSIRYIGIDTPERDDPCYAEATAANQTLVGGQTLTLLKDASETDRYGRLLRYIYTAGNVFVNAELVKGGWALAKEYPPDTAHAAEFAALAGDAKALKLGCWPTGVFGQ